MSEVLLELYRHKTWATLALIDFCAKLDVALLDATTPGTYGSIRDTLRHLVRAEEGYMQRVTGRPIADRLAEDASVDLADLAARIRRMGPEWEALARDPSAGDRMVTTDAGWRLKAADVMAQAVHHADDHRTHVLSVISAHGTEGPDLDLWSYADANGRVEHVKVNKP